ncbi:hypothetical protein CAI16_17905 [Virgibacillus dokdonensis]|uniref:Major facilitator superfamily (MFS) profile domain-containing protein n=1 Tax=Virgibacillus dokdonensis TaxID=302167 RepID=A0A3E0WHL8_9BACI|nr:MFS transporter [Virgibacillus dokdonensis]RFA32470.1 hypothetical protein CAI16_17905 [Virgibacillus dokdonensis]
MWRNKNFTMLFSGQIISFTGIALFSTSLPFLIIYLDGQASDISATQSMFIIPQLFLLLFGGMLVDQLPKKFLIVVINIMRGLALLLITYLILSGNILIWHIYLLSFFLGALNTLYRPTLKAILPSIVDRQHLVKANSYRSMAQQVLEMVGPVLAAYLVATFGIFIAFGMNGLSFLLAAFTFVFISLEKKPQSEFKKTMFLQFKEGFQILFKHKWLGLSILIGSIVNIGVASFDVIILPIYANEYFNGIESFGWFLSSMALGAFLGAWLISKQSEVSKSFKKYYIFMFSLGLLILFLSFSNYFLMSLIIMFGIGFSITSFVIIWDSTVQELIEEEYLGRVTSLQMFGGLLFLPIGYYIFGFLIEYINIQFATILSGLIIMSASLVGILNDKFNRAKH